MPTACCACGDDSLCLRLPFWPFSAVFLLVSCFLSLPHACAKFFPDVFSLDVGVHRVVFAVVFGSRSIASLKFEGIRRTVWKKEKGSGGKGIWWKDSRRSV
jgi:hypothetical protein